jgi:hypothetical protein
MSPFRILIALSLSLPAGAAAAQGAPSTGGELIGRLFDAAKLRSPPPPPAEFERGSRPEQLEYRPFDPTPERGAKPKSAAELQALGAGLDAAIAENRRKAARIGVPDAPAQKRAH